MADFIEIVSVDRIRPGSAACFTAAGQGHRHIHCERNYLCHRRQLSSCRRLSRYGKARRQNRDLSRAWNEI